MGYRGVGGACGCNNNVDTQNVTSVYLLISIAENKEKSKEKWGNPFWEPHLLHK